MKQFTKELFKFSILPLILLVISIVLINYISKKIDYKLNRGITKLYIGDSHIQYGVNDSLVNVGKNVSMKGESFYFSYYKLKKLIEENKNIETVYLGFSYHNLSSYYDASINGEHSPIISPKYFYILPVKEQFRLVYWNLRSLPTFIKGVFSIGYRYSLKDATFSCGSYSNNFTNTMASKKSMEKRLQFQYYTGKKLNTFSDINLLYLNKINDLCKSNKIDLLILNTPLHPYYQSKIPINFINKYKEIVNSLNLRVFDFNGISFSDSCFTPDGDHLSLKGAYEFTKELIK